MGKELLWLACLHHALEIVLAAVTSHLLGSLKSSRIVIFQRFQKQWLFIDKTKYQTALSDEQILGAVAVNRQHMITFAQDQLDKYQPRNDYQELLKLTIIFLGGSPTKGISFKSPEGLYYAKWMAKITYSLKIWIFCAQFKLTTRETNGVQEISLFAISLYLEAWFTAPFQDLHFLKAINQYPNQNISYIAMKKFLAHLWYLI